VFLGFPDHRVLKVFPARLALTAKMGRTVLLALRDHRELKDQWVLRVSQVSMVRMVLKVSLGLQGIREPLEIRAQQGSLGPWDLQAWTAKMVLMESRGFRGRRVSLGKMASMVALVRWDLRGLTD